MIEPDDIPDSLVDELFDPIPTLRNYLRIKTLLANELNAAINAGVVSPPCRILRSKFGELRTGEIYVDDNAAQSSAMAGDSSEHWKGQTK